MAIVAAVAALLLATTAISATSHNVFATYKRNQATSQANACGNEFLPTNVGCQNTGSQIQGDENGVALAAQQTFPEVDMQKDHKKVKPVPPVDVGCPTETVWDITIREQEAGQALPIDTVVCLIQGLGNHPAVVIEPGEDPMDANVNTNQPNVANCNAPEQQLAQVTSGNPPNPLDMGSFLCATLMSM